MTRRAALQWFYDRGAVITELGAATAPSAYMMTLMEKYGQLTLSPEGWILTDKGRQDLWEPRK